MKQSAAVNVIYSLIPQMRKGDPGEVLTKYAQARNLSAAQLERLGHVFNTASTLSTLEKNRDGVPDLLDVPGMVNGYISTTGKRKRASFLEEATQEKQASAEASVTELPHIWVERHPELPGKQKEATDLTPFKHRTLTLAFEAAERAIENESAATSKFASVVTGIARKMMRKEDHDKFATAIADLEALNSVTESEILSNKLAKELAGLGIEVKSGASTPFKLARDRTGYYGEFDTACSHLKEAIESRADLFEALGWANQMADALQHDGAVNYEVEKRAAKLSLMAEAAGLLKEAGPMPADKPEKDPQSIIYLDQLREGARAVDSGQRDEMGKAYNSGKLVAPALGAGFYGTLEAMNAARTGMQTSIPSYLKAFSTQGEIGQLMQGTADKNREDAKGESLNRAQIAQDTMAMATLKKLMITDEILATKAPEKVFEAFSAIRQASPEVASDPSLLRVLLRQAMETQGVDIDTASAIRKFEHGGYRSTTQRNLH